MPAHPKLLIVEDDDNSAEMLKAFAETEGFATSVANSLADARQQLILHKPQVVLLDLHLPDGSGMDLFADESLRGDAEVVLITGNASVETSVEALRLGAADYLIKPVSLKLLRNVLHRLIDAADTAGDRALDVSDDARGGGASRADADDGGPDAPDAGGEVAAPGGARDGGRRAARAGRRDAPGGDAIMKGDSAVMREVARQVERVAKTSVSVFVVGESGTGKELVALSVHRSSRRRNGPFEAVNCGAISAQLIESELFGHEKGSFTGAIRQHKGFFERASGGTLFLDEITEMSLDLQVKLLRVLETGTFSRVGSDSLLRSDVRIVAATNRDPFEAIGEGKLREDLYYRLNVFQIVLAPLRERDADIRLLAGHFLQAWADKEGRTLSFADDALERLDEHDWPGNVRELRNYVHRAAIMADGERITADALPPFRASGGGSGIAAVERLGDGGGSAAHGDSLQPDRVTITVSVGTSIADMERELILATLDYCAGAKERTAEMLGISLKTLYNRLRAYE
ncbi:MAG: sigma-54-dependent transcriptional regulator [Lautropia sp.]